MQLSRENHFQKKENSETIIIQPWVWICARCHKKLFEERKTLATINKIIIIKIKNLPSNIVDSDYTNYLCPNCKFLLSTSVFNVVPFTKIAKSSGIKKAEIDRIIYFKTNFACFEKKKLILAREAQQNQYENQQINSI